MSRGITNIYASRQALVKTPCNAQWNCARSGRSGLRHVDPASTQASARRDERNTVGCSMKVGQTNGKDADARLS